MDDDDSPEELIRRGVHKKRDVPWDISDSDDDIDGSEEGESESSNEDDVDDNGFEGEEGEDNEVEDDEDEEEDAKAEDGVLGETSATIPAMSSDEDADKCPICLNTFSNQPVATPENCEHYFCLDCILAWSKNANSCPVDRITFNSIYLRISYGGKVQKMITVQKPVKKVDEVTVDLDLEQTNCEVCQGSDREDRLLLCDGCDAGYHMECLTPPLDTVPVEEWFCPECVANNNNSGSVEEQNQTQRRLSTGQPTTSRSQSRAVGPIRAIARTQHSERVRANVNRHRISQARTSQLAQTYQNHSNWLDETINAVVAGLNTAIYVRDLTPHPPTRRRRKTGIRRKTTKKVLSNKGKKGRSTKPRKKRKGRKTKSKRTMVGKKVATPQSRIANSLGLSKDKNNCSLPTICRPSEHTLSSMRVDIGAASLSIYGDPFDLDPFADRDEAEQEETVSSLLEAKRRGISHSAFRSHQPVARPVGMGMSRRGMDTPQTGVVVEAAPVPDLLGSILSGQSLLLMDSSDVVISRDGSLKASQSASLSTLEPGLEKRNSSEESSGLPQPVISASLAESSSSSYDNRHLPGASHTNLNRPLSQCSSAPSDVNNSQPPHFPDLSSRGRLCLQPPLKKPSPSFGVQRTNGSSMCGALTSCRDSNLSSYSKTTLQSQCQPNKAPTKPMWMDVDNVPRIPKIKRDAANYGNSGANKSNSNSSSSINNSGMPETAVVSFAGDKNRQKHVGQQSNTDRQPPNQGAGSSQAFSNSFSICSSSVSPSASLSNSSASSSTSSSISFRINASGNSLHSRRLVLPSFSASGSSTQGERREKLDEAKKRQEHRDQQKMLASRSAAAHKKDINVYDPSNPTISDSSSSDSESESSDRNNCRFNSLPRSAFTYDVAQSKQKLLQTKNKTPESEVAQEESRSAHLQTPSRLGSCTSRVVKVEKDSILVDIKMDNRTPFGGFKRQTGLADLGIDMFGHGVKSCSGSKTTVTFSPVQHSLDHLKTEEESGRHALSSKNAIDRKIDSSGSGSSYINIRLKQEKSDSRSPPKDLSHEKKTSSQVVPSNQHTASRISQSDRDKTKDHLVSKQEDQQKKTDKDRERRSRSRDRRTHSSSGSSLSSSPKRSRKNKRRHRSRSSSTSSSRERSRRKRHEESSQEKSDDSRSGPETSRVSKNRTRRCSRSRSRSRGKAKAQKHGRSRSKSPSKSSYKSRSKERWKERTHSRNEDAKARPKYKRRSRSRSSSREKSKERGSSKSFRKASVTGFPPSKCNKDTQNENKVSLSSVKDEKNPEVKKDLPDSPFVPKIKKENNSADTTAISVESKKEVQIVTKVKKNEQPSFDMFESAPTPQHTEKEDAPLSIQGLKKEPIEIQVSETITTEETAEITPIKAESLSSKLPVTSAHTSGSHQEAPKHLQPDVKAAVDQANAIELNVPTKHISEYDEDISVDMLLDILDCVKQEHTVDNGANIKQQNIRQEGNTEAQQLLTASRMKIQSKRVTWNVQDTDGAQPEKYADKLALFKEKRKQEATHKPSPINISQDTSGPASVGDSAKGDDGTLPSGSGCQEYLKKLHMQERAVEEVKLAIKPFYQKRDINKEEYKDILRKAVRKVCHSKSGEINPVKVGNLVKAYVDKYKHARKHQKTETKPKKTSV
ncbi:PHD and RING finger domain-containing protein 1 isoform X1 [Syngnathus scovelli]|uniref:PHD and RING finger domain-containing protein 1 isoform X1 n=1 Tax=Syngnathus scovelli TaxID=161590 RepID=UPI0021103507|nr:PHD and RING finger domain-containing protein 1 isoform X1 [Syngnathus scovelli]